MKTDFAKEILAIAHRVIDEQKSGRSVDPARLDWAKSIVAFNPGHRTDPAEVRAPAPVLQEQGS